jgi:hypothetical protein
MIAWALVRLETALDITRREIEALESAAWSIFRSD